MSVFTPVALAQTGLNGTFMSVGCDYSFANGSFKPKSRYVAIVKNGKGKTAIIPVKLEDHGMAGVIIDGWRPGDQPFSGHFAELIESPSQSGKPELQAISAEIDFPLDPNQD